MKTKIYSLIVAAAALTLSACGDDTWIPKEDKEGTLVLSSIGVDVNTAENLQSRADGGVDVSNFVVEINKGDQLVQKWTYSDMPELITLPVGEYTANVYSHEVQKQDWEKPYYLGSQSFKIESNAITHIGTVTCKFASLKVTINYTDELKAHMGSDCKVTVVANDEGRLEYSATETRAGFFEVADGSVTLVATFEGTVAGHPEMIQRIFTDVAPGTHYSITYSVKDPSSVFPDETGGVDGSGIAVDTNATDVNEGGNIEIEEEVIDPGKRPGTEDEEEKPDDPITPSDAFTFNHSESIDFDNPENEIQDNAQYWVEIVAQNPIESLTVSIDSPDLTDEFLRGVGLAASFDLATGMSTTEPVIDLNDDLTGTFKFPTRDDVKGKTTVRFDISEFVPLLSIYPGKIHSFVITVKDNAGNSAVKTLSFKV